MTVIRAAIDSQDATRLRIAAHTLKGALRYFGDTRAYEEAFCLENLGAEGKFSAAAENLTRLDPAVAAIVRSMQDHLRRQLAENAGRSTPHPRPGALAQNWMIAFLYLRTSR